MTEEKNMNIITKTPEKSEKIKDPKRVAAGKRLAELNKKAKEAKKKEQEQEQEQEQEAKEEQKSYFPSLWQISAIFGIIVTGINIFLGYKQINPVQPKEQFQKNKILLKNQKFFLEWNKELFNDNK